jgi:hypothetical protein
MQRVEVKCLVQFSYFVIGLLVYIHITIVPMFNAVLSSNFAINIAYSTHWNLFEIKKKVVDAMQQKSTHPTASAWDQSHAPIFPSHPASSPAQQSWQYCFHHRSLVMRRCENARPADAQAWADVRGLTPQPWNLGELQQGAWEWTYFLNF